VALTAAGYGDFSPLSLPTNGRVFLPFYSYFGRGVAWVALQIVPYIVDSLFRGMMKRFCAVHFSIGWFTPKVKIVITLFVIITGSTLGAFVFSPLEGWPYGDAVYYSIITLTTSMCRVENLKL